MNKLEVSNILDGLRSMYGNDKFPQMTEFAMDMWYEAMKDLDFKKTKQAIANYLKVGKYPPTVADIREQYNLINEEQKRGSSELEKIFAEMQNYYPNGNYDKTAKGIFFTKLLLIDSEQKLKYAEAVKNAVIDYVKRCELGTAEMNMTLSECLASIVKK